MTMSNRAYSLLDIKSIDEEKRILVGIASTPSTDRMDDVVESKGCEYTLPIPFLWQHRSDSPVGFVTKATVRKDGIEVEVQIQKTDEPGLVKDRLDAAWQDIRLRLVRGLSIGFKPLETAQIEGSYGTRFLKWLWLELSAVTIAANGDCSIQTIKSIDAPLLAASGHGQKADLTPPGASGPSPTIVVKAQEAKPMTKKSIAEQISAFESTRATKAAAMDAIMDKASETGVTLDAAQKEEYDGLEAEVSSIDEHVTRLRKHEASSKAAAVAVAGADQAVAAASRSGIVVETAKKLPPGMLFTRYALAHARARGNPVQAYEMAKANEQWAKESPSLVGILQAEMLGIIQRTAVNPATTSDSTWAGPLVNYQTMTQEFIDYLRPRTIIGRIPNLRKVPFKIKVPRQTGAATVNWVGEGKVKPLTSIAFDTVTMEFAKIAGIIPLTEESIRFSNPSIEALVREELANAIVGFMDSQFVDPTKASNDVSPASITYNVTPTTASGTTAALLRADIKTLVAGFLANNYNTAGLVWLMTQQQALAISLMVNSLGQPQFPGISMDGGTLAGLPVVTSENIPATGSSPTDGGLIILAKASDILLADDGQVTIDASREASLQMDTAPDSPPTASTVTVSLWQQNMVAIKAERYINWAKARSTCVAFIQYAKYAE